MVVRPVHLASLFAGIGLGVSAWSQQSQIERARQFDATREVHDVATAPAALSLPEAAGGTDFDSFGVQQMLVCGPERARYFRVLGEISGFATDNVGLSRRDPVSDSFMVGTFGIDYRRPLKRGFQVDAAFQAALFRYNEYSQLDFNSFDVGAGIGYHASKFGGVDVSLRYSFNALQGASSGETLFENHSIAAAVEKIFPFSKAHHAFLGLTGRAGFAVPRVNERHELGAYAGYHIEVLPRLDVDLGYRYAYYLYTAGGRLDHNQTASLGVKYRFREWCSASVSSFYVWDYSNRDELSYRAGSLGGALTLLVRF